jgi:hypothetical protein
MLALSLGLAPSGGIHMQFERGKPQETPNAPYRAARIKGDRWRSAGLGFEPGRAGPRMSCCVVRHCPSQDAVEAFLSNTRSSDTQESIQITQVMHYQSVSQCIRDCFLLVRQFKRP